MGSRRVKHQAFNPFCHRIIHLILKENMTNAFMIPANNRSRLIDIYSPPTGDGGATPART
uniref:Uncharacterized protein n=1 Tax=Sphingomonas sp. NS2 TaxID=908605 RepID=A0A0D4ZZF4_9SPHN|nr:hypothetical protein plasmid201_140 [Sphingomonas sp. NS2]